MSNVEYLKDVYRVFRELYGADLTDAEASQIFEFVAQTKIKYDKESPSMAVVLDSGDFVAIDTPFGMFRFKYQSLTSNEFKANIMDKLLNTFEAEKIEGIDDYFSLAAYADTSVYSIRKLPWRNNRLSKTSYSSNWEGCLSRSENELVLEEMNAYIESSSKPVKKQEKRGVFDILFHGKSNKKK